MEQKGRPFEGGEPFEREQKCERDVVGQRSGICGVAPAARDDGLRQPRPDVHFPPRPCRTEPVDAQPCDRRAKEGAIVRDPLRRERVAPAQERVLNHVLGFGMFS